MLFSLRVSFLFSLVCVLLFVVVVVVVVVYSFTYQLFLQVVQVAQDCTSPLLSFLHPFMMIWNNKLLQKFC